MDERLSASSYLSTNESMTRFSTEVESCEPEEVVVEPSQDDDDDDDDSGDNNNDECARKTEEEDDDDDEEDEVVFHSNPDNFGNDIFSLFENMTMSNLTTLPMSPSSYGNNKRPLRDILPSLNIDQDIVPNVIILSNFDLS